MTDQQFTDPAERGPEIDDCPPWMPAYVCWPMPLPVSRRPPGRRRFIRHKGELVRRHPARRCHHSRIAPLRPDRGWRPSHRGRHPHPARGRHTAAAQAQWGPVRSRVADPGRAADPALSQTHRSRCARGAWMLESIGGIPARGPRCGAASPRPSARRHTSHGRGLPHHRGSRKCGALPALRVRHPEAPVRRTTECRDHVEKAYEQSVAEGSPYAHADRQSPSRHGVCAVTWPSRSPSEYRERLDYVPFQGGVVGVSGGRAPACRARRMPARVRSSGVSTAIPSFATENIRTTCRVRRSAASPPSRRVPAAPAGVAGSGPAKRPPGRHPDGLGGSGQTWGAEVAGAANSILERAGQAWQMALYPL